MPWKFLTNPESRAAAFVVASLTSLAVGVLLMAWGMKLLSDNDRAILDRLKVSSERWQAFSKLNPHIIVPDLIETDGINLIMPPEKAATPEPTATEPVPPEPDAIVSPTPSPKTKTIIRYRSRPTPKPWFHFP